MKLAHYVRDGIDLADWYDQARRDIRHVCRANRWEFGRFVDVLAVTSPRCAVTRNVRVTVHYLHTGRLLPGVLQSTANALEHYELTGELATRSWRGHKVKAFAAALRGDRSAVVVDVWICHALGIDHAALQNGYWREKARRSIVRLAYRQQLPPAHCQAALWAGIRRHSGRVATYLPILSEVN